MKSLIIKKKVIGRIRVSAYCIHILQIAKMMYRLDEIRLRKELKKQTQKIDKEIMGPS